MKERQWITYKKKEEAATYQKNRLLHVADSYQDFARMLQFLPVENEEMKEKDRFIYLQNQKMIENRKVLSGQLKAFAETCQRVAEETFEITGVGDKKFKNAVLVLKEYKIALRYAYYFRSPQKQRVYFDLKLGHFCKSNLKEVTGLLSVSLGINLVCVSHSKLEEDGEYHTYEFEEESHFKLMLGIAKAIKEGTGISGDNHSIVYPKDHHAVIMLSDGVGSGRRAGQSSDVVMELMESLLSSGESLEQAVTFVNNTFSTVIEEGSMPTLDLCEIDLSQGVCEFIKAGAAMSFIKTDSEIECIKGAGTPLGFFPNEEIPMTRKALEHETYLIMVSDGILTNLNGENTEAVFTDYIGHLSYENPKELANQILQFAILRSGGKVLDDMTVLVAGIFDESVI